MRAHRRPLSAVLLLDKPSGPSSNAALQRVRGLYRAEKAGHTGSLDPLASGLLPVCFGEATKLTTFLLSDDKGYRATARLGIRTDTYDADGRPLYEASFDHLDADTIDAALQRFVGEIDQVPPMYSALKRGGLPLYELARQGVEVAREARRVRVDRIRMIEWTPPFLVFDLDCSSGTYVRSLVDDLGQQLGCGAHVHALRRTWAAPFRDPIMHGLMDLDALMGNLPALDAHLLPVEVMVEGLPKCTLEGEDVLRFGRHGNQVVVDQAPISEALAVMSTGGRLLGIARCSDGHTLKAVRVLNRPLAE